MRLIDVDDAINKINDLCVDSNENWIGTDNQSFVDHSEVIDILCDAPTVDAVEVVRCKDCIYQNKLKVTGGVLCDHKKGLMSTKLKDDDFCSYGERRVSDV